MSRLMKALTANRLYHLEMRFADYYRMCSQQSGWVRRAFFEAVGGLE